jgi:hypothetical protein
VPLTASAVAAAAAAALAKQQGDAAGGQPNPMASGMGMSSQMMQSGGVASMAMTGQESALASVSGSVTGGYGGSQHNSQSQVALHVVLFRLCSSRCPWPCVRLNVISAGEREQSVQYGRQRTFANEQQLSSGRYR